MVWLLHYRIRNSVLVPSSVLETNIEDGPDQVLTRRCALDH